MASKNHTLELSAPHVLAEALRIPEFEGFLQQRYVAPPDHAAILIRDGQIVDTYQGANFAVGGMLGALKGMIVGKNHVRVVLADLRPFSLQAPFKALTRDRVEVACVATLELQLDPERAASILGLLDGSNRTTRPAVLERFRPHLTDRVIEATTARVDASELRGNVEFQDKVQADVMREVERLAGDLGLIVRGVSLEWAINAVEREAMERSELDREQERLDQQLADLKRNLARHADGTELTIRAQTDEARLRAASEDELIHLALSQELALVDAREIGQREQEMKALSHEIEVLRLERLGRFENQLAEVDHLADFAQRSERVRRTHRETEKLDTLHAIEMQKLAAFAGQDIEHRGRNLDVDHTRNVNAASAEHIGRLAGIEQDTEDRESARREGERDGDSRRDLAAARAASDAKLAELKQGASMTPEQILAINAGLNSDVASVLAEQARTHASGQAETMALMREMVAQATDQRVSSEHQARELFRMGMDGAARVAQGAGGGSQDAPGDAVTAVEVPAQVECKDCGRENDSTFRFCVGCGSRLRA